jgi:N-acetylneuraminic acid mutarotase
VGALNGEVYVLGGFTPDAGPSVQAYDPESDAWRDVADFPAIFHHPNVGVVGSMLYVAGFHVGSDLRQADGRVYAYDPALDEWLPRASMPVGTERGASCVAALDNDIYVFGGANDITVPDASVYDTVADEWTQLPPMPALREHCIAAAIGGKIYIVSGRANSIEGIEIESWMYDPAQQRYEERPGMPTPRAGSAGEVLGGRIFVFGGEGNPDDPDGIFHEVEAFDPAANSWEQLPDMLIPRHGFGAAVVGDRIYLPGGGTSQGFEGTDFHTVFFFESAD